MTLAVAEEMLSADTKPRWALAAAASVFHQPGGADAVNAFDITCNNTDTLCPFLRFDACAETLLKHYHYPDLCLVIHPISPSESLCRSWCILDERGGTDFENQSSEQNNYDLVIWHESYLE